MVNIYYEVVVVILEMSRENLKPLSVAAGMVLEFNFLYFRVIETDTKKGYWPKIRLLLKKSSHELVILTKFHNNLIKIVDFLNGLFLDQ